MIARRNKVLGSAYKLFYDEPEHIVRGEGVWLYDSDGRKFLDMYNNVPHVGHCHPHVVEALTRQMLAGPIGKDANISKLRPPMVFTQENADHFLNTLDDVFSAS